MTKLRKLYETLRLFSTAPQLAMCKDHLRGLKRSDAARGNNNLAALFLDALAVNDKQEPNHQPFYDDKQNRKQLSEKSKKGYLVQFLLSQDPVRTTTKGEYTFSFMNREFPHLRAESLAKQNETAYMDYIGVTKNGEQLLPVLGEIKFEDDENPYFAFIQLLTYLSEIATSNQLNRIKTHEPFGKGVGHPTAFDLHIMLVNSEVNGEMWGQIAETTPSLVKLFLEVLEQKSSEARAFINSVKCLNGVVAGQKLSIDEKWSL